MTITTPFLRERATIASHVHYSTYGRAGGLGRRCQRAIPHPPFCALVADRQNTCPPTPTCVRHTLARCGGGCGGGCGG